MTFVPRPRLRPLPPPAFTQRAGVPPSFLLSTTKTRYLPIAGTNGYNDPFAVDPKSPFQRTLAMLDFDPILDDRGKPFNPQIGLDGIRGQHAVWNTIADMLYYFLEFTPERDRNLIVSSHAGQIAWILAASGFRFRSVTFCGTPNRRDVGAEVGITNIGMPQVIYDEGWDWMGWLGALFDKHVSTDRSFAYVSPPMRRYAYENIGHIRVLTDSALVRMWRSEPWLENIRQADQEAA